ncbi:ABC transporter substrate-binding protein [Paenibacillus chitinolyticus]|uniref:ABC transporter substrate-binding protein n=1 Tax=Paenibacillus chitinolyticus TaxID=79263 RepID=UPI003556C0DE
MRKISFILIAVILMISASACSSRTGNGEATGTQNGDKTTESPGGGKTEGNKPDGGPKTIVFSTFFPDDFFKEAKKRYEAKHPNITIELKYVETDDAHGEENIEKYIKTTNTALLSGKGPDLIEMDLLHIGNYVNKKLLANISEMMDKDPSFKREQYFTNILDNVKLNGGIYGMPLNFIVYGFIGNETAIEKSGVKIDDKNWNWSQFADVAKELMKDGNQKNKSALYSMPESLLNVRVKEQYATFVDPVNKKANFETAAFTGLMKQVKSLFDDQIATDKPIPALFRSESIVSPEYYIRDLKQSEYLSKGYEFTSKFYAKPHAEEQKAGGYFQTYKTIGINEKSSVKEEAWDFLKFMLSDEVQEGPDHAGFPMNKSVYEKRVKELLKVGKVKSDQEMGVLKDKVFDITAKDIQDLDRFLSEAIYPVEFKPSKIEQIIMEEAKSYFKGQKSAEAVAKLIQNRVTTFLNE